MVSVGLNNTNEVTLQQVTSTLSEGLHPTGSVEYVHWSMTRLSTEHDTSYITGGVVREFELAMKVTNNIIIAVCIPALIH